MANIETKLYSRTLEILCDINIGGKYIQDALTDSINEDYEDRKKLTFFVYGTIEKQIEIDYYISKLVKSTTPKIQNLLRLGIFLLKYSTMKNYAVVSIMVELSKSIKGGAYSGFVNATLKKTADTQFELPEDELERLSILHSFPLYAVRRYFYEYGLDNTKKLLEFRAKSFEHIRIRCDKREFLDYLDKKKTPYELSPLDNAVYADYGYLIRNKLDSSLYTKMNYGSMQIVNLAKTLPTAPTNILDVCSAPGGKACYLADLFPSSEILACDVYAHRINLIESYCRRLKISNIKTKLLNGSEFNAEFDSKYDLVVCDNPCSSFGNAYSRPDVKNTKEEKYITKLANISYKILNNAKSYVKVGGHLIFSTCSLFREENEFVLRKFLKENAGFSEVTSKKISPITDNSEGFFMALIKRNN